MNFCLGPVSLASGSGASHQAARSLRIAAALLAFLVVNVSQSQAQFHDLGAPLGSPAWWTLTDEISPAQLREALRDSKANLDRYLADVDRGTTEVHTEYEASSLTFFVNGSLDPELVPLWVAFDSLATIRTVRPWIAAPDSELLADFGVSEAGVQAILAVASRHRDLITEQLQDLKPLHEKFERLRQRAEISLGGHETARRIVFDATKRSDARFLAPLAQTALPETIRLLDAYNCDVHFRVTMVTLPELREGLEEVDWNSMRSFFLHYVTPALSLVQSFRHELDGDHL